MNAVLIGIGVVAVFAAIVGGGVKLQNIEVGNIASVWRQLLLGLFGLLLCLIGAIDWSDTEASATNAPATLIDDANTVADTSTVASDNAAATDNQSASEEDSVNGDTNSEEPAATTG